VKLIDLGYCIIGRRGFQPFLHLPSFRAAKAKVEKNRMFFDPQMEARRAKKCASSFALWCFGKFMLKYL